MSDHSEAAVAENGAAGTEIERREPMPLQLRPEMTPAQINRAWKVAKVLHASGVYKDVKRTEQAFAKILVGWDLGLTPAQAMAGLHFVEGNVQIHYRMLGAFVRRNGYDYKIREVSSEQAKIEFFDPLGESLGISQFTQQDANIAGLDKPTRSGAPSNYVKYPRNMLVARAMSNGVGWFCPEVLSGVPVYTQGEIEQRPELTAGDGDGAAQGLDLGPEVEAVLLRAAELGHETLGDRATAEMALADQPPEYVAKWVQEANETLAAYAAEKAAHEDVPDAELVSEDESDGLAPEIAGMRGRAREMLNESRAAHEDGDEQLGMQLEQDARDLSAKADSLEAERPADG